MKVTQTASLQPDSVATPAKRKAVMGGIVTPLAVAAHVRKQGSAPQNQVAKRKAVMGGIVTPQAVAAHARRNMGGGDGRRSI